jgi:hypothetical protein
MKSNLVTLTAGPDCVAQTDSFLKKSFFGCFSFWFDQSFISSVASWK